MRRQAAGFSANEGDNAERAAGVAAVLDFQYGASVVPFPAENGSDEDVGEFEDVSIENRRRVEGRIFPNGSTGRSKLRPYNLEIGNRGNRVE